LQNISTEKLSSERERQISRPTTSQMQTERQSTERLMSRPTSQLLTERQSTEKLMSRPTTAFTTVTNFSGFGSTYLQNLQQKPVSRYKQKSPLKNKLLPNSSNRSLHNNDSIKSLDLIYKGRQSPHLQSVDEGHRSNTTFALDTLEDYEKFESLDRDGLLKELKAMTFKKEELIHEFRTLRSKYDDAEMHLESIKNNMKESEEYRKLEQKMEKCNKFMDRCRKLGLSFE